MARPSEGFLAPRSTPPNPFSPDSRAFVWGVGDLLAQNKPKDALTLCRAGVETHPNFVSGWWMMARVLSALGEGDGALEWLDAVLALSPTHPGALGLRSALKPTPPEPEASLPALPDAPQMIPPHGEASTSSVPRTPPSTAPIEVDEGGEPQPKLSELPGARDLKALLGGMGELWQELGSVPGGSPPGRGLRAPQSSGAKASGLVSETLGKLYMAQGDSETAQDIFSRLPGARQGAPKGEARAAEPSEREPLGAGLSDGLTTLDGRVVEALLSWAHHFDEKESH